MIRKVAMQFHGRELSIETGRLARQAGGAAVVRAGETVVLATAVGSVTARPEVDFLPLTCDYQERTFAAGKIPGGFFKREGRPTEKEILTSRLIDRPIRPLFPKGYRCETQVIATVLSHDLENEPDVLALIAASAALELSDLPFAGPIGAVRIGRMDGEFVVNPSAAQMERSELDLVVAAGRCGIVMVEGGAQMVAEDVILEALFKAQEEIRPILDLQEELKQQAGQPKREAMEEIPEAAMRADVEAFALPKVQAALELGSKTERRSALKQVEDDVLLELGPKYPERERELAGEFERVLRQHVRGVILREGKRIDGRGPAEIRPVSCEIRVLPRTHGSALFTRGETQAMVVTTLGTAADEQKIDALVGESYKKFMLHYNFPPFSVGEVRPLRGPGRREVGHGALAERAIAAVLPGEETFPYTIRVVSEILESNGSSSMATVCGASLSLMDAGVPVSHSVAGIAMGLIKEGEEVCVLSDILGDEDHLGDMDLKVAGTKTGVTALQMDIKTGGITREIMREALYQARDARLYILKLMDSVISEPRPSISAYAPRIVTLKINKDRIRDVIGPGGKMIRSIIEETGVKIEVEDDGTVAIASADEAQMQRAVEWVQRLTAEPEVGKIYKGKVKKIVDFGAFVEILPGTEGLVHISQLDRTRVKRVSDILKEGDEVPVKVLEIDRSGKIRLSRREALVESTGRGRSG